LSQLGFALTLELSCNATNIVCDFGQTSAFNLGALPPGVSWTSGSGVLFTGGNGAVPEPATWAMMILGFGMVGSRLRRRFANRMSVLA
jgi:PEP-CTERM motif